MTSNENLVDKKAMADEQFQKDEALRKSVKLFVLTGGKSVVARFDSATNELIDPCDVILIMTHQGPQEQLNPFVRLTTESRYKVNPDYILWSGTATEEILAAYSMTLQNAKGRGCNVEAVPFIEIPEQGLLKIAQN